MTSESKFRVSRKSGSWGKAFTNFTLQSVFMVVMSCWCNSSSASNKLPPSDCLIAIPWTSASCFFIGKSFHFISHSNTPELFRLQSLPLLPRVKQADVRSCLLRFLTTMPFFSRIDWRRALSPENVFTTNSFLRLLVWHVGEEGGILRIICTRKKKNTRKKFLSST